MDYYCINVDKFASKNLINNQKDNFLAFNEIIKNKSYVPLPSCLLNHIVFDNKLLSLEKLLYLTSYFLSYINLNKNGHRQIALSALKLSKIINCSKSQVLAMQKSLSQKGYFFIVRQKNSLKQNNRNLLAPLLPNEEFVFLSKTPDKKGIYLPLPAEHNKETPLSYLERTKQYVPLNYQIFKLVASDINLNPKQKVLWLLCYSKAYKNSLLINKDAIDNFSFTSSYVEFATELDLSVGKVSANLNVLARENYLQKQRFYVKNGSNFQDRCDKSLWHFTLSMPALHKEQIEVIENRKSYAPRVTKTHNKPKKQLVDHKNAPVSDPDYPQNRPQLNKDFKINKDRSKEEADFQKFEKEDREKTNTQIEQLIKKDQEQQKHNLDCKAKKAISQKATENKIESSIKQNTLSDSTVKFAKKSYNLQRKSLSEIEPITEEEAIFLRDSSGRDFSLSYMNKLVKKLASLFPDHGFYTRKLFLSYISKTLSFELRQTTKANNTDFTFKADEQVRVREKYLEKVETSYDTSPSSQLKKKIAGRFDSSLAYKILNSCDFQGISSEVDKEISKTEKNKEIENKQDQYAEHELQQYNDAGIENNENAKAKAKAFNDHEVTNAAIDQICTQNQTFTIYLSKSLNLTEYEQELLLEQIRAVHGNKIKNIEFKQNSYSTQIDKNKKVGEGRNICFDKPKNEQALINEALLEAAFSSVWHKISENLIIKYGIHLYKAWFEKSKMNVIIDEQYKTLSLKASTGFIASYVQSNYFTDLRVLCMQESYSLGKIWA